MKSFCRFSGVFMLCFFLSAIAAFSYERPFDFLKNPLSVNSKALASSNLVSDKAENVRLNPASSAYVKDKEIYFSYSSYLYGLSYSNLSFAMKSSSKTNFSAGAAFSSTNGIDTGNAVKRSYSDFQAFFNITRMLDDGVYGGLTLKFFRENFSGVKGASYAFDAGLIKQAGEKFKIGMSILNIGGKVDYAHLRREHLPLTYNLGAGYNVLENTDIYLNLRKFRGKKWLLASGVSFKINFVNLKLGYNFNHNALNEKFTFGLGFDFDGVKFDYAFMSHTNPSKHTHSAAVKYCFKPFYADWPETAVKEKPAPGRVLAPSIPVTPVEPSEKPSKDIIQPPLRVKPAAPPADKTVSQPLRERPAAPPDPAQPSLRVKPVTPSRPEPEIIYRKPTEPSMRIEIRKVIEPEDDPGKINLAQLKKDAYALYKNGEYSNAAPMYENILKLSPRDTQSMVYLSDIYDKLGKYEKSVKLINEAVKIIDGK